MTDTEEKLKMMQGMMKDAYQQMIFAEGACERVLKSIADLKITHIIQSMQEKKVENKDGTFFPFYAESVVTRGHWGDLDPHISISISFIRDIDEIKKIKLTSSERPFVKEYKELWDRYKRLYRYCSTQEKKEIREKLEYLDSEVKYFKNHIKLYNSVKWSWGMQGISASDFIYRGLRIDGATFIETELPEGIRKTSIL